jgi:hypothetical protein
MNTHTSATPQGQPEKPTPEAEGSDVNVRGILLFMGVLVVTGILIHFALYWMQHQFRRGEVREEERARQRQPAESARRGAPNFPGPRLQVSPPADMAAYRAREEAALNSYGWVNRTSGIVRIPIERAMEIMAQSGLPTNDTGRKGKSPLQLLQERSERK